MVRVGGGQLLTSWEAETSVCQPRAPIAEVLAVHQACASPCSGNPASIPTHCAHPLTPNPRKMPSEPYTLHPKP